MLKTEFILSADDSGRRLDRVIRKFLADIPLSALYAAIRKGRIKVNGKCVPLNYKTAAGDTLSIADNLLPSSVENRSHNTASAVPKTPSHQAEHNASALSAAAGMVQKTVQHCSSAPGASPHSPTAGDGVSFLLRTNDLLIVNKPAGIAVHGENSLAAKVLEPSADVAPVLGSCTKAVLKSTQTGSLSFKPGPLHRLDQNTTGLVCFSQSLAGAQWFSQCLREKTVVKYYLGVIRGTLPPQLISTDDDTGAQFTSCYPLAYYKKADISLMLFRLITGKKHQIRRHMQLVGHPLAGDSRYGGGKLLSGCKHYLLHAWRLYFPVSRPEHIPAVAEAPLFPDFAAVCERLFPQWKQQADAAVQIEQRESISNY